MYDLCVYGSMQFLSRKLEMITRIIVNFVLIFEPYLIWLLATFFSSVPFLRIPLCELFQSQMRCYVIINGVG